ncbi:14596_t:CDS:2, partial [Acaulospora colombiana]
VMRLDEKFTDVGPKGPLPKRTGAVAGQKASIPAALIFALGCYGAGGAGLGSKQGLSQSSTMLG